MVVCPRQATRNQKGTFPRHLTWSKTRRDLLQRWIPSWLLSEAGLLLGRPRRRGEVMNQDHTNQLPKQHQVFCTKGLALATARRLRRPSPQAVNLHRIDFGPDLPDHPLDPNSAQSSLVYKHRRFPHRPHQPQDLNSAQSSVVYQHGKRCQLQQNHAKATFLYRMASAAVLWLQL